ncbi:uncharacterized protein [Watersipora subatra]
MEVLSPRESADSLPSRITPATPLMRISGAQASNSLPGPSDATSADNIQINDRLDLGNIVPDLELNTVGCDSTSPLVSSTSHAASWLEPEMPASSYPEAHSSSLTVEMNESYQEEELPISEQEESPQIDVAINNVVCTFSTRCHLNLRTIALTGDNVELKKAQGMLNMKLRTPSATASIWSSGKITITGANSEENCKIAARRIARKLQKAGFNVKFSSYRVVNVLGTCSLPFGILLTEFSNANLGTVQYEPELHPGATYQIKDIKATLKIFSTGSLTITAPSVDNVQKAVERVFPLVYAFKKPKKVDPKELRFIEKELEGDTSEAEMISDSSDLDLEPGEIPSTKSRKFSNQVQENSYQGYYYSSSSNAYEDSHEDDYGSDESDE